MKEICIPYIYERVGRVLHKVDLKLKNKHRKYFNSIYGFDIKDILKNVYYYIIVLLSSYISIQSSICLFYLHFVLLHYILFYIII